MKTASSTINVIMLNYYNTSLGHYIILTDNRAVKMLIAPDGNPTQRIMIIHV